MPSYVRNPVLFLSRAEKKTAGLVSNLAHCSALALDEPLGGGISGRERLLHGTPVCRAVSWLTTRRRLVTSLWLATWYYK